MKLSEGSPGETKKSHTTFPQVNWSAVEIQQVLLQNC